MTKNEMITNRLITFNGEKYQIQKLKNTIMRPGMELGIIWVSIVFFALPKTLAPVIAV